LRIDLTQLQVRTYTDDIRPYIKLDGEGQDRVRHLGGGRIEWERFPQDCQAQGELTLVAVTRIEVGLEPTRHLRVCEGMPGPLKQAHLQATALAQTCRAALVELVKGLLGIRGISSVCLGGRLLGGDH
jgi:hypothetical protein